MIAIDISHIHCVGIKGVGMTALALILKEAGKNVSGSDVDETFITDSTLKNAGLEIFIGFDPKHITGAQLVITTGAHGGFNNPEVAAALQIGIPVVSMAEALAMVMDGKLIGKPLKGISIAGTHGKTTTTAIIATILKLSQLDPSYFIGTSYIPSLGSPGHYGAGDYFVVESDEYATEPQNDKRAKFLWLHPKYAVFTNIELDHPDIYQSVEEIRKVFLLFAKQINANEGKIIVNGDDPQIQKLINEYDGKVITYGLSENNDYRITDIQYISGITSFIVFYKNLTLGSYRMSIHGEHNCLNALAAIIVCREVGIVDDQIKSSLVQFKGSVRRLEYKGTLHMGALLYDDYAHHPTEVKKTLSALRSIYPDKKIICIFQPHTFSRTRALFTEFTACFTDADELILTEIYASAREGVDETFTIDELVSELKLKQKAVIFLPKISDVVEYLDEKQFGNDKIVITMGAGNIYQVGELAAK